MIRQVSYTDRLHLVYIYCRLHPLLLDLQP